MPDIVTGKIFVDGEKGITATKLNQIQSLAVIQPDFVANKPAASSIASTDNLLVLQTAGTYAKAPFSAVTTSVGGSLPVADNTQNGMMRQVSGNTTDVIDGTNHSVPIASMPGITQMRLRSFNAIGNSNFEVDQRNVGNVVSAVVSGTLVQDRWIYGKAGTLVVSGGQRPGAASEVLLPGTNFALSRNFHRITLTTAEASLGAGDNLTLYTQLEGVRFRELQYDVHSLQVLVRSSVAGLAVGLSIRDPATVTKSLVKLATIPTANTWTLLTFPNLPVFPSGNFSTAPGVLGYLVSICLAAGTTLTAPANDTWQNGNFVGAVGQSNFANNAVNSTFDVAFIQHEPGAVCTTPIDLPFTQNLNECQRYYWKSNPYGEVAGATTSGVSIYGFTSGAVSYVRFPGVFPTRMAKTPTVRYFGGAGAVNNVRNDTTAADVSVASQSGVTDMQWGSPTLSAATAGASAFRANIDADTGW